jgi:CubicO group peptidase (beta-lactamase class C family)
MSHFSKFKFLKLQQIFLLLFLSGAFIIGCSSTQQPVSNNVCMSPYPFKEVVIKNEKAPSYNFYKITNWIQKSKNPVLSVLVSMNGEMIFEYYASKEDAANSRNTMSITKSFTSALLGIAIDRGQILSTDSSVSDYFPHNIEKKYFTKFKTITIKDVMDMSTLDARTWPRSTSSARLMARDYHLSPNRFEFAIQQKIISHPGKDFEYTDVTPAIISGIIQNATNKSLFDFANLNLFEPMGYKNQGWLFRDQSGYDNASYGLKLRPIDIHKFGVLYLNQGCWNGQQLVSKSWVQKSFTPQIKSDPSSSQFDYGWYWWNYEIKPGWMAHLAKGWHGQVVAVLPERGVVITMTAMADDKTENKIVKKIFNLLLESIEYPQVKGEGSAVNNK